MEIKLYRHKTYKDIYLKRNWNIFGSPSANWWDATKNLYEALESYYKYENGKKELQNIEEEYNHHHYQAGIVLQKEMEFDGYTGILKKECIFPLDDFELVTLIEKDKE